MFSEAINFILPPIVIVDKCDVSAFSKMPNSQFIKEMLLSCMVRISADEVAFRASGRILHDTKTERKNHTSNMLE